MTSKYRSKLHEKRILVLGGTSGIGFAVAEAALEHGAVVVISGSSQEKLDQKLRELTASYPEACDRISGQTCDLSSLSQLEDNIVALLDFATGHKAKKIDHVVITAGDPLLNPAISALTIDNIHDAQTVRIVAPLMVCKHLDTYIIKAASSSITLTTGAGTLKPYPGWTLTPMVGGALEGLIRSLAVNLAPIRVNGVASGSVVTELWGGGHLPSKEKMESLQSGLIAKSLTGQAGRPEDQAEAYIYFMNNHFITGQLSLSDGGALLK